MTLPSKDVRDGVVFLLGLILLVLLIVSLTKFTQDETTYTFAVRFPRAQGIQNGAVVQVAGVRVGQVVGMALERDTKMSLIQVKVSRGVVLSDDDRYAIATGGLVGEKFLDITPKQRDGQPVPDDLQVQAGDIVDGAATTEINDLVAGTSMLLDKFNTTADRMNELLNDEESRKTYKVLMRNLTETTATSAALLGNLNSVLTTNRASLAETITDLRNTTHSSAEFAAGMNQLLRQNEAELAKTLTGLQKTSTASAELIDGLNQMLQRNARTVDAVVADLGAVTKDIRAISASLSPQIATSKMVQHIDTAMANTAKITERLEKMATVVEALVSDKELATGLREAAQHMRKASGDMATMMAKATVAVGDLQAISANMKDVTGSLKTASADLPYISRPFRDVTPDMTKNLLEITRNLRQTTTDVSGVTARLTDIGKAAASLRLEPDGRFMVLTDGPQRARADANLTISGATRSLRVGVANIDKGNQLNLQLGQRISPELSLRYGLVQSRLGGGGDLRLKPNVRLSAELFDPKSPRANLQADYRLPGLGDALWFSAGIYDLLDARRGVGAGVTFRPPAGDEVKK